MDFLPLEYKLNGKYKIESYASKTDFSNIYLSSYNNKQYIIKECFPSKFVIRDNNIVFTDRYQKNFKMLKESFYREANVLKRFNNDNIIKLNEYFEENGTVYLIMEYFKGRTLKKYILENDVLEKDIVKIFFDILEAIKEIHNKNVIHRDIKPSNILINGKQKIKIIDFGSSLIDEEKNGTYIKVTDCYSPLEMYSLKAENDVRTDIYSLCALLYFMLNKQKPMDVLKRFYYPELLYEKEVDELLKQVIFKGLSINKDERYSSCEELLEELKKL